MQFRMSKDVDDRGNTLLVFRDRKSFATNQRPKCIGERRLIKARLELVVRVFIVAKMFQYLLILLPRNEFEFAKLHRLKTTRRIELVAKLEEADLCHRLEYVYLCDQHFFDTDDS